MATTTGTTSGVTDMASAASVRTTYTNPLRSRIQTGNTIRASDLNLLRDFISTVRNHRHTLVEYTSIGEFGNRQSTVPVNRTASTVADSTNQILGTLNLPNRSRGEKIESIHHNLLRIPARNLRSHSHQFTDSF